MADLLHFERAMTEEGAVYEAPIFEAGDYPDKQVSVTEEDLDGVVARFTGDVPLKDDHQASTFDGKMGWLKAIWRSGKQLIGRLVLDSDFAKFLQKHGIKKLSAGFARDPLTLKEVSLTLFPRVQSASLPFHTTNQGDAMDPKEIEALKARAEEAEARIRAAEAEKTAQHQELERLRFDAKKRTAGETVKRLTEAAKKLTPAQGQLLEALLVSAPEAAEVTFNDKKLTFPEALVAFVEAGPDLSALFSEQARADASTEGTKVSEAQQETNKVLGVSEESYLKHRDR